MDCRTQCYTLRKLIRGRLDDGNWGSRTGIHIYFDGKKKISEFPTYEDYNKQTFYRFPKIRINSLRYINVLSLFDKILAEILSYGNSIRKLMTMPIKPIEFLIVVLGSKRVNILDLNNVYNPPSRFNDVMRFKILRRPGVGDFVVFNDFRDDDLPEIEFIEPYAISKKIFKDITLRRSSEAGFSYQPLHIFDRLDQSE